MCLFHDNMNNITKSKIILYYPQIVKFIILILFAIELRMSALYCCSYNKILVMNTRLVAQVLHLCPSKHEQKQLNFP